MHRSRIAAMVLTVAIIGTFSASSSGVTLDYVDIGKPDSEDGHSITGWGPIEPANSGGHFGGIDDCRAVYSSHDGNRWARVELDFGPDMLSSKCLTLHHLDGICCDAYQAYLYPKGRPDKAQLIFDFPGNEDPTETWLVSKIQVNGCGTQVLLLESMAPEWSGFETYGQMCFDIIQVDESPAMFDLVDVGNEASEAGHSLADWGPIEPATSGGSYGGATDCRAVYAPEDNNRWATLDMDFGECMGQKCVTFQHLEGIANDAFELYVYPVGEDCPDDPSFVWPGDECPTECWLTSGVVVEATGLNTLKFVSTEPEWSGWGSYGQACMDTIIVRPYNPLKDAVDIGCELSEAGHNLQDWGPIEPQTSGGSYGGIENCRPVYAFEDGNRWATLELDFGYCCCECKVLNLHHLDGACCDAFEVYVYPVGDQRPETPLYVYAGDMDTAEIWYETRILVDCMGRQTVELVSTEEEWAGWEDYGQVCFDWIKVECGEPCAPTPLGEGTGVPPGQPAAFSGFTSIVPNPFNPSTEITFRLEREGRALVTLHDIRGRCLRTLVEAELEARDHTLAWDGRDDHGDRLASGVYLALLRLDGKAVDSGKLVLLK